MGFMALLPLLIGGGLDIAGGLLGGAKKTTQQQSGTQTETFDPTTQAFRNLVMKSLGTDISQPESLDPSLLAEGVSGVDQAFNSTVPAMQSEFSSRGLGQSGLFGGSLSNLDTARLGGIVNLMRQLSGTAFQRKMESLGLSMGLTGPTGQTSTGSGTTTGPGAEAGLGSGLGDLGTMLGVLSAIKAQGGN